MQKGPSEAGDFVLRRKMHSLKTSYAGQIFALAKPHDSVSKKTRNRIPKEERKALILTFINKHQKFNNGSFPSLSLTHKEVGGSFYTIREIVREIIQENRLLGPGHLRLQGQDQTSIPVPPNGFNFNVSPEAENIHSDGSEVPLNGGSHVNCCGEVNATQLFEQDAELLVHQSMGSSDMSRTQFQASCTQENAISNDAGLHKRVQTVFATKPQDKELKVDNKDQGSEEILFIQSQGTKSVSDDEQGNDAGAAISNNTLGAIDLPQGIVVETFPLSYVALTMESSHVQPSELDKDFDGGKPTETKVETESSIINHLGETSSSTSVVNETIVTAGQMPNHISVPVEKEVGEKLVNPASVDVKCVDAKGTVAVNGALVTEPKIPTSSTESRSSKNDKAKVDTTSSHARNEVAVVEEKIGMEKGTLDASDGSSSHKGNSAPLNRIKPESWKGQSNMAGKETNPLVAILKSFVTALVKFWSD